MNSTREEPEMDRYDKAVIAAVVMAIVGILIMILPPLEDGGFGFMFFLCAIFTVKSIQMKRLKSGL